MLGKLCNKITAYLLIDHSLHGLDQEEKEIHNNTSYHWLNLCPDLSMLPCDSQHYHRCKQVCGISEPHTCSAKYGNWRRCVFTGMKFTDKIIPTDTLHRSLTIITQCLVQLHMMTSSNGTFSALLALCAGNSPVTREFATRSPVTPGLDIFFDLLVNKRLSKQSCGWWFDTPASSLWRHGNAYWFVRSSSTSKY